MAIYVRNGSDLLGLVHHKDRGVQCLSIRYTERPGDADYLLQIQRSLIGRPRDLPRQTNTESRDDSALIPKDPSLKLYLR